MASLIAPLACGVVGAASGSATIYQAGTSTRATVYSDAEGVTAVSTHTLDSNGGVVRYVEERVDVVVADANGSTVRTFTWGTDAREARVENAGFTGTTSTGASAAGGRTTVDAVLSEAFESFGTTDWRVLVSGAARTISDAVSSSAGLVFNVQASAYGATGDGSTDDTAAIQAAINAADAAGGGTIYFPCGSYSITALTVAASTGKMFFLGEAASGTFLVKDTDGGANPMLTLGNSNTQTLMNLTFKPGAASDTGTLVAVGSAARATFISCAFDPLNGTQITLAASTTRVSLVACPVAQNGASSRIATGSGSHIRFVGCDVTIGATSLGDYTSFGTGMNVYASSTRFVLGTAMSAGTTTIFPSTTAAVVSGCQIRSEYTSGTVNVSTDGTLVISGSFCSQASSGTMNLVGGTTGSLHEAGCCFPNSNTNVGSPATCESSVRLYQKTATSGSATGYTPSGAYHIHEVTSTGASMAFANPSPDVPGGNPLIIIYKNTSGGNITPTFGTAYSFTTAVGQVNNGNSGVYVFIPRLASITTDLVNISPQAAGGYTL